MKSSVTAAEPVEVSADAAPAATAAAIDHAHLARMTFGDRKLENEVLDLFERQAGMLLGRMDGAAPALMAALAHTLCGSASGIGAWRVAWAAFELERVASGREPGDIAAASARVCAELAVTRIAIAERRRSA